MKAPHYDNYFQKLIMSAMICVVIALLLIHAPVVLAETAISNLGEASNDNGVAVDDLNAGGGNRAGDDSAQSFTTGSTSALFNSVTLSLAEDSKTTGSDGFSAQLWSSSGSAPDSLLLTLTGTTSPTAPGFYTYTAPALLTLDANTTYWIVATVTPGPPDRFFDWATTSGSATGGAGWSLGITVTRHSSNEVPGGWTDVTGSGVAQMGVDITAAPVPEPTTTAAFALGCGLMLYRRKK